MACEYQITDFDNLQYACNTAFGGIKALKLEGKDPLDNSATIVEIEFNTSDAFSNANETKSVSADGSISVAQTVQVELPRLDKVKYDAVNKLKNPNFELKLHILTKAGVMLTYGAEYGCFMSVIDVASGTSRADKNRIQLTFTGDEEALAPVFDDGVAEFAKKVVTPNKTATLSMEEVAPTPKKRRIIEVDEDEV